MGGIIPILILLLTGLCLDITQNNEAILLEEIQQTHAEENQMTRPRPDGYFELLERDTTIERITFKKGTVLGRYNAEDYQGPNPVILGTLAKNQAINGITYAKNTEVTFNEFGKLIAGSLLKSTTVNSIKLKDQVFFFENGKLSGGTLAEDTIIDNKKLPKDTKFNIDENGRITNIVVLKAQIIQDIKLPPKTIVYFYESGGIKELIFSEDTNFNGIWFKGGYKQTQAPDQVVTDWFRVKFYKSGKIQEGISAKDQIIQNQKIGEGKKILFDEDGLLLNPR